MGPGWGRSPEYSRVGVGCLLSMCCVPGGLETDLEVSVSLSRWETAPPSGARQLVPKTVSVPILVLLILPALLACSL